MSSIVIDPCLPPLTYRRPRLRAYFATPDTFRREAKSRRRNHRSLAIGDVRICKPLTCYPFTFLDNRRPPRRVCPSSRRNPTSVSSAAYNRQHTYVCFRIGWDNRAPFSPDSRRSEDGRRGDPVPTDRKIGAKMEGRSEEMGIALEGTRWESRDSPSIDSEDALRLSYALSLSSLRSIALQFLFRSTLRYKMSQKRPILILKTSFGAVNNVTLFSNEFQMKLHFERISIHDLFIRVHNIDN